METWKWKSLSSQLIYKTMRGKYSKSNFFHQLYKIISKGSNSIITKDVENIFQIEERKLKSLIDKGEKKKI